MKVLTFHDLRSTSRVRVRMEDMVVARMEAFVRVIMIVVGVVMV